MAAGPLLALKALYKNFGGILAINDLSFELAAGELLGLIGPNGSGKTTAVNLITGFVKPSSGEVVYRGRTISGLPPYAIVRMGISRTFQMVKPFYQLPAYKNMIIPLCSPRVKQMAGGRYGDRDAVALDLLEEVGFERDAQVAYKSAAVLPQGYLKRLELSKAIALKPDVVILDVLAIAIGFVLRAVAGAVAISVVGGTEPALQESFQAGAAMDSVSMAVKSVPSIQPLRRMASRFRTWVTIMSSTSGANRVGWP